MLTRTGVARRLGKSIATVRRMEGVELHPTRDERGVHHFDPDEVDAVASGEITGGRDHRMRDLEDYWRELERRLTEEHQAEEDRRRQREQAQQARDELIRNEVARQVAERMEQFEKAQTLDRVLNLIREGADTMDDDQLENWWEIA